MKNGENNGVLAGVPFVSPSRAPRVLARSNSPFPFPRRLLLNKSPAVYILSRALDGLSRENGGSVNRLLLSHFNVFRFAFTTSCSFRKVNFPLIAFSTLFALFPYFSESN